MKTKNLKIYSVWVGGGEINDYYMTEKEAETLAKAWKQRGYPEVSIEKVITFHGAGIYDRETGELIQKMKKCPADVDPGTVWEGSESDWEETFKNNY